MAESSVNRIDGAHVVLHRLLKASKDCPRCKRKSIDSVLAVLLCKRTQDAPIHPGYWGLVGGKIKDGEPPEEAAVREVGEELEVMGMTEKELGIKIKKEMTELCNVPVSRENGNRLISYFSSPLEFDMDRLRLKQNKEGEVEGEGLGWFTAEETHHLVMRPEDRVAVIEFFKNIGV